MRVKDSKRGHGSMSWMYVAKNGYFSRYLYFITIRVIIVYFFLFFMDYDHRISMRKCLAEDEGVNFFREVNFARIRRL